MTLALATLPASPLLLDQLDLVLLNNDPAKPWRDGLCHDISLVGYRPDGEWSVTYNLGRINVGTLCLICRSNGKLRPGPAIAGLLLCDGPAQEGESYDVVYDDGTVEIETDFFVQGPMWGLPNDLWVDGTDVVNAGWPRNRAPWGQGKTPAVFTSGVSIPPMNTPITDLVDPGVMELFRSKFRDMLGVQPGW